MLSQKKRSVRVRAFVQVFVAILLVLAWPGLLPNSMNGAYGAESTNIIEFERGNPVYSAWVDLDTARKDLGLPETLRAVCELAVPAAPAAEDSPEGFRQTAPVPDDEGNFDYYWYGYVAPRDAEELHAAGQPVIYTIYYADDREAFRVHGTYNGENEGFYACDEKGDITGIVIDVPVTWRGIYDASSEGPYALIAKIDGFNYLGDMPTVEVTVSAQPLESGLHEEGHDHEDAEYEYTGKKGYGEEGDVAFGDVPAPEVNAVPEGDVVYVPDTLNATDTLNAPDLADPAAAEATQAAPLAANGEGIPIMPLGIGPNGGGANDVAQDNWMLGRAPTSGNGQYYNSQYNNDVRLPGSWIDYVNTIWHNKGVNKFDWTAPEDTGAHTYNGVRWAWKGTVGNGNNGAANKNNNNTTVTPTTDPLCIPTYTGTNPRVYTVYSGEQLRWALSETTNTSTTAMTIQLGANIDLNGNNFNWGLVQRQIAGTVTLTSTPGNHFTIYNMGILQTTFGNSSGTPAGGGDSVGLYSSGRNSYDDGSLNATRNFQRFSMETCKVVAGQSMTYVGSDGTSGISGSSVLGQHTSQSGTVSDVHVLKSLVFGVRQDYPNQSGPMNGTQGSGSTFGTQIFMTGISNNSSVTGSSTISNCSVEGSFVYGREHVISFMRGVRNGTVSNCYAVDNLICGTAQHSAAFMSCATRGTAVNITNCFASSEMYGSLQVSGFVAFYDPTNITNCYSTGKLEGYQYLGGFYTAANTANGVTIERCYSTTLVGLRTNPARQGGFYADMYNGQASADAQTRTSHVLRDVYAAGEVGNYDVNLNGPVNVGGFASMRHDLSRMMQNSANGSDTPNNRIQYCYYDKQTTAMREWTV
ncbi:MAG: hypothetical protein FWG23_03395, partial [Eggerthellaceae bacterium]|nr:hypothetical protein [Eggerthellaceae bacterium]